MGDSTCINGRRRSLADRFWAKVADRGDGCWRWIGSTDSHGYGQIYCDGRVQPAHRVSYRMTHGSIPDGHDVDHICGVPGCIRPDHLRAITHQQNGEHRTGNDARNTSGYRGVSWDAYHGNWYTYCNVRGKRYSAGRFDDADVAGEAIRLLRLRLMTCNELDRPPRAGAMTNDNPEA